MYRVYDKTKRCWITDNIYMSPNGELYKLKKTVFGNKMVYLSEDDYVWHREINLTDKNNELIFEGDYIEAEVADDKMINGIVAYAYELASYVILCDKTNEFFRLGLDICDLIKIVGNVFDGYLQEYKHHEGSNESL